MRAASRTHRVARRIGPRQPKAGWSDRLAGGRPGIESAGDRLHAHVAHLLQGAGRQRRTAAGLAVQQHPEVARIQLGRAAELELEHAARDVDRARNVAGGELVGLADVDQHVGIANRGVGGVDVDFVHMGLGGGNEVECGFHGDSLSIGRGKGRPLY